jgi:hypothetical protein
MATCPRCDRCELPGLLVSVVIGLGFGATTLNHHDWRKRFNHLSALW